MLFGPHTNRLLKIQHNYCIYARYYLDQTAWTMIYFIKFYCVYQMLLSRLKNTRPLRLQYSISKTNGIIPYICKCDIDSYVYIILCHPSFSEGSVLVATLNTFSFNKMVAIFKTTFWMPFSWMKRFVFPLKLHWSLFLGSNWKWVITDSGSGLVPSDIAWSNVDQHLNSQWVNPNNKRTM